MDKILVIDDDNKKRSEVVSNLRRQLQQDSVEVVEVDDSVCETLLKPSEKVGANNSTEKQFERYLTDNPDIKLVVVDHDLSGYNSKLSESVVSDACKLAGVPHCRYSRVMSKQTPRQRIKELVQRAHLYSAKLDLKGTGNEDIELIPEDIVRIHSIYLGFEELRERINKLEKQDFVNEDNTRKDIVDIATEILDKDDMEPILSGYARSFNLYGDYVELLEAIDNENSDEDSVILKFKTGLAYLIGFWLYNSVLKFPGVILKSEAAASYLDLNYDDFIENKQQFNSALYTGPFSQKTKYEFWWRFDLDDILIDEEVDSGYQLLLKKGIECKQSACLECGESAGYFCLVKEAPVCKKHSIGALDWMPRGADLSRIATEAYELYHPYLESKN